MITNGRRGLAAVLILGALLSMPGPSANAEGAGPRAEHAKNGSNDSGGTISVMVTAAPAIDLSYLSFALAVHPTAPAAAGALSIDLAAVLDSVTTRAGGQSATRASRTPDTSVTMLPSQGSERFALASRYQRMRETTTLANPLEPVNSTTSNTERALRVVGLNAFPLSL